MSYVKNIDYIGLRPQLTIENSMIFQTKVGGLLSILIMLGTFAAAIFFGREMWEKSNPVINSSTVVDPSPGELVLDKLKWDFVFGLQYNNKLYIDDSIYQVKSTFFTFSNGTFQEKDYKTEPCTVDSFYESTYNYFKSYGNLVQGGRCVSKNQDFKIQLNKLWGQQGFNYFDISLRPCVNSTTSSIICKPQEVIDKYLASATFSVYTLNYYISTKNYTHPFSGAIFNDFYPVSKSTYTQSVIFFTHSIMDSDVGWLFSESDYQNAFALDRAKINFYLNNQADGRFLKFQYQLSNLKITTTRKYLKLQEFAYQIGGIAKFFVIVGMVINFFPSEFAYKEYLVNEFFDDNEIIKKQEENIVNYQNNNKKEKALIEGIHLPNKIYFPKREKLKFNYFEVLFSCLLYGRSNKLKKLIKSFKLLRQHVSIENFLQITRNISKLRYFLLSNYENDLFDYIGNPVHDDNSRNRDYNGGFYKMNNFVTEHNKEIENKIIYYDNNSLYAIMPSLSSNKILRELLEVYNTRPSSLSLDNELGNINPINKRISVKEDYLSKESSSDFKAMVNKQSPSKKKKHFSSVSKINNEAPNVNSTN